MHFTQHGEKCACGRYIHGTRNINGQMVEVHLPHTLKEERVTCTACQEAAMKFFRDSKARFETEEAWRKHVINNLKFNPYKFPLYKD